MKGLWLGLDQHRSSRGGPASPPGALLPTPPHLDGLKPLLPENGEAEASAGQCTRGERPEPPEFAQASLDLDTPSSLCYLCRAYVLAGMFLSIAHRLSRRTRTTVARRNGLARYRVAASDAARASRLGAVS